MNKVLNENKNEDKNEDKNDNFLLISVKYIYRIVKIFLSISGIYFIWILLSYKMDF